LEDAKVAFGNPKIKDSSEERNKRNSHGDLIHMVTASRISPPAHGGFKAPKWMTSDDVSEPTEMVTVI